MPKLTLKIAIPIILVGLFAITVFIAIDYSQLNYSFYIVLSFFVIYVFFFGFATGQNLSFPIKQLLERAEELIKGNLSSRVYLESKDELSELAMAFNKIAEELEASRQQEENIGKSVDIKVRARTQALEEIMSALEQKVKNRTIELERLVNESGKMAEDVKNKEVEINQLKKDLNDFKQGLVKYGKQKKETGESREGKNQEVVENKEQENA